MPLVTVAELCRPMAAAASPSRSAAPDLPGFADASRHPAVTVPIKTNSASTTKVVGRLHPGVWSRRRIAPTATPAAYAATATTQLTVRSKSRPTTELPTWTRLPVTTLANGPPSRVTQKTSSAPAAAVSASCSRTISAGASIASAPVAA